MKNFALAVNYLMLLMLIAAMVGFIQLMNPVGFFMVLVTLAISIAVWKKSRWGYFALAALGLACFQLAKQELAFVDIKRYVMIIGFSTIPVAVFLHEVLARRPQNLTDNTPNPS